MAFSRWCPQAGRVGLIAVLLLTLTSGVQAAKQTVSGHMGEGLRYLPVPPGETVLHYKVYRGDYIKFDLSPGIGQVVLKIPDLGIEYLLPPNTAAAPYFKMKQSGRFAFTLGRREGQLEVVAYQPANYRELTAAEAAAFLKQDTPLVLDVRTPGEFKAGHLPGAMLIPVQELQRRIGELAPYRDREILA